MQAFSIVNQIISPHIRVLRSGRNFELPIGRIPISHWDADDIVRFEAGKAFISNVGLRENDSGIFVTSPTLSGLGVLKPVEQKSEYRRFDLSALVLWETGDPNVTVLGGNYSTVLSEEEGTLLILFLPESSISIESIHPMNKEYQCQTSTLGWTGHEFMWL